VVRRPQSQFGKGQNYGPDAYEAEGGGAGGATSSGTLTTPDSSGAFLYSEKQRILRENGGYENLPSSIRPGAYKEIPGRGLVRNDTLRFGIMNTIQRQKRSLRRIFSSQRKLGSELMNRLSGGSRRSVVSGQASGHLPDDDNLNHIQEDRPAEPSPFLERSSFTRGRTEPANAAAESPAIARGQTAAASLRTAPRLDERSLSASMQALALESGSSDRFDCFNRSTSCRTIDSVLVEDDDEVDKRLYRVGRISTRTLHVAAAAGVSAVARPVYTTEPSAAQLEALCTPVSNAGAGGGDLQQQVICHAMPLVAAEPMTIEQQLSEERTVKRRARRYVPRMRNSPRNFLNAFRKNSALPKIFRRMKRPARTKSSSKANDTPSGDGPRVTRRHSF
jgi:hypothetical protein